MTVKAVSFVAASGTGKTALVAQVIAELKRRGYLGRVLKHDAHRFDIDHPGKDSFRFTAAAVELDPDVPRLDLNDPVGGADVVARRCHLAQTGNSGPER
jgi:hypothetical protein